jgi:hypothetical protein
VSDYTPPTFPLSVTWEGTEAYTSPTFPVSVSWEDVGEETASATGTIVFGASASASVSNTNASATGAIVFDADMAATVLRGASSSDGVVFGASASAQGIFSGSATAQIQFGATAGADVGRLPDQVFGVMVTVSTIDTLTFTWGAADNADTYNARLYRNGSLVEQQLGLEALTATFTGLEDGVQYVVEINGVNDLGPGPAGVLPATTAYIPPTAPTNLRQEGETYVLIKVLWDAPPEKVTFYESMIEIVEPYRVIKQDVIPPAPTERVYGVPRAATTYRWRIRAGNPGGLSAWAELDTIYPIGINLDSRLAVLPAAYLEDYLFPDTWDGGTNLISEGVGDDQVSRGNPLFSSSPPQMPRALEMLPVELSASVHDFNAYQLMLVHDEDQDFNEEAVRFMAFVGSFDTTLHETFLQIYEQEDREAAAFIASCGDFDTVVKMFVFELEERDAARFTVSVGDFTTEVPA